MKAAEANKSAPEHGRDVNVHGGKNPKSQQDFLRK
jgi:hypothetical protein